MGIGEGVKKYYQPTHEGAVAESERFEGGRELFH